MVGIFSVVGMALAQSAATASLTLTGGTYTNSTNVTTATGVSFTYNWNSTNGTGGKTSIQISKGGSAVASDACGNLSGDFSSAVSGTSGSLGPIAIASCEAGYTYTITYSVTNSGGQTVSATPLVINVTGGSTTSGQTVACSENASTYVAPPTQEITAILPNFPPFSIVTMDSYMAQTVQGDLSNPSAYTKNPLPSGIPSKANIISDMITLVNNRCNFYPSICTGINQTAMGTQYGNLLINNLEMICASPYGNGLTGSIYDNYNGASSSGAASVPVLNISSISECTNGYGECPNSSPTASTMIGGDSYTLTVQSNYDNTPFTFYWQSPSGAVTNQAIGSTDASGKWTLSAISAASVTPGVWQEWVVFPSETGSPQSNKITVTILPVPAACTATGQLCTGNETSGSCRPELQQNKCIAGTATLSNGVGRCQVMWQNGTTLQPVSATYCTGTETSGPCTPSIINQCAADRLAETWGPSCIAPQINAPAPDTNTALQTHYAVQCPAATTPTQPTTPTGPTTTGPATGGTGTGTSGNTNTAVSSANNALNSALQSYSSQLSAILNQISGGASTQNTATLSSLSSQVSQISQSVSGLAIAGTTSAGTTTGGPTVSPTPAAPVSVTVGVNLLNVRSAPSISATIGSTVSKGQTVSVTGAVMGDTVSGDNYWWTTLQGTYIWTGGTVEQPSPSSVASG